MKYLIEQVQLTLRGRNALLNIFELWVGLAGVISLILFIYDPLAQRNSSISHAIGHKWAVVWQVAYGIAGLMIWYGLLRPSPRWEIAALCVLGSATAINGVAILNLFGLRGITTAATLIALSGASWIRAFLVYNAARRLGDVRDVRR